MSLAYTDINHLHMSKKANMYSAATHVHTILTEHSVSPQMVQGLQAQEECTVAVQSLLGCGGTIIANTNLILHMRSILTCTVAIHLGIAAASSSTLHCGSPELHSGVQTGCYHVSDPSEVTLQPCHRPLSSQNGRKQCQSGLSQLTQYAVT